MAAITFDRLKFVDRLKHSGVSEKQAKAFADAHKDSLSEMDIATKQDIKELKRDLRELECRLTYQSTMRFGGMLTAAVAIIVALQKIL